MTRGDQDHNFKYNFAGVKETPNEANNQRAEKTFFAKDTDVKTHEQLLEANPKLVSLDVGTNATLYVDDEGESLWIANKSAEVGTVNSSSELFGCGSGKWALGKDGQDGALTGQGGWP